MSNPTPLTEDELLTLAALARSIASLDGRVTSGEVTAVAAMRQALAETSTPAATPYRSAAKIEPLSAARWEALIMRAARELIDEDALRDAARRVVRQEAREAMYGLLVQVAIVDSIGEREWNALVWLEQEWSLEPSAAS